MPAGEAAAAAQRCRVKCLSLEKYSNEEAMLPIAVVSATVLLAARRDNEHLIIACPSFSRSILRALQ